MLRTCRLLTLEYFPETEINYGATLDRMIGVCGFVKVATEISKKNFPVTVSDHRRVLLHPVVAFLCANASHLHLAELFHKEKPELRPANLLELLIFVEKNPELDKSVLIAQGSVWHYSRAIMFSPAVFFKGGKKALGVVSLVPAIKSGFNILTFKI